MKTIISFVSLILIAFSSSAQNIHSPAEILKILTDSKLTYEIGIIEKEIPSIDYSQLLNYNDYYRVENDGEIFSKAYELNNSAEKYFLQAEKHFKNEEYQDAKKMYLKVLDEQPGFYKVMTYIGQIYRVEGDKDEAINWFKKAIENNFIDYMAHWFLSTTYSEMGKSKNAIKEVTIARILNRNNPRIKLSYEKIYSEEKLKVLDWNFTPQMILDSISPKEVSIQVGENWMGYALAKAVWKFEPNYKESMGSTGTTSTLEEKEALLGLMSAFNKKVIKKNPEFKALNLALDSKMIDEYILYEIILPQYPFVAYQLPRGFIDDIAEYVIRIRGKEK